MFGERVCDARASRRAAGRTRERFTGRTRFNYRTPFSHPLCDGRPAGVGVRGQPCQAEAFPVCILFPDELHAAFDCRHRRRVFQTMRIGRHHDRRVLPSQHSLCPLYSHSKCGLVGLGLLQRSSSSAERRALVGGSPCRGCRTLEWGEWWKEKDA